MEMIVGDQFLSLLLRKQIARDFTIAEIAGNDHLLIAKGSLVRVDIFIVI